MGCVGTGKNLYFLNCSLIILQLDQNGMMIDIYYSIYVIICIFAKLIAYIRNNMENIESVEKLKAAAESNENVWFLLYKHGSAQSDCAVENLKKAEINSNEQKVLLMADINNVRDIHPEYGITSVPALLYFQHGQLRNVIKGCHQPQQFSALFDKVSVNLTGNDKAVNRKNVIVYTTPTCSWCNTIKRHFQENGIQYREVDVSKDHKAADEMVRRSGQQGVPQTDIDGEVIVGFDKTKINALLGIN